MTVSLITEGDEARVSFVVDNSSARHAVEMSLPRLRDLMDGAGLSLTDADVSERHSKEDEEKPSGRLTEEAGSSSGSDAEGFEQATPPDTSQLIDAFA
jgi:flagellar hook-length control protein FliK